ncbi:DNA-repair protein XRCC1 [Citrus sinensis]|uniref:BRCT domain-containing protein n=3 Tax=Citrus clementina TaxID=85681 RepID=V4ULR1_CITCL|nr:DNA-repair protein XRCC1 isoform X1 [Citrus x clementina]XP_024957523.2 DNA-repair protein XRCC1 isoform X1 [Citrus sinensis]ESR40334.1 hypothetical protein CICLE_v10025766mg [Citrus x clementina]KAH9666269.1 DNA-repair protein XRCC1 [Citrus sinensis]
MFSVYYRWNTHADLYGTSVLNSEFDMSDSNTSSGNGNNKTQKRNLPSWMTSSENESNSHGKKPTDTDENEEYQKDEKTKQAKGRDKAHNGSSLASSLRANNFSKLLEGVVFVLSGFVNPERSTLRSRAIEMGANYQADWNSNCTLLVCAFPNTPKFRQVEADCGTIVSKEWILECYNQKKLVDIDSYLMHAGKPWRKGYISHKTSQEGSPPRKCPKVEKQSPSRPASFTSSKSKASNPSKEKFSPSELKKWAADDLKKTISWLESQEEKPEQSEIKQIAAEGILTCLQDAIDSLEQNQDIQQITEQWQCVPRVVEELAKLEGTKKVPASPSKKDLCKRAKACKKIYEEELGKLDNETREKTTQRAKDGRNKATSSDAAGYDSEETIEMTEEEIDLAYKSITS